MSERLSLATLDRASAGTARPSVDPRALELGIVHLGLGAFHRAHQAMITEDAMAAAGDASWGIAGTSQRSRDVVEQLRPQDGLYTVLEKSPAGSSTRIVGSIREALHAADDHARIRSLLSDPRIRVVSLTITEKGYLLGPDRGLDLDAPGVREDVATLRAGADVPMRTAVGLLAQGLLARDGAPVTVMPCDNMASNGGTLASVLGAMLGAAGRDPAIGGVGFAGTVVDRIVPITGDAGRAEVERAIGLRDEGAVLGEPFWQWVIEDSFVAGRPAWDRVGATMADDVEPFEMLKLRILNSTHSLLAYLGALAGFRTIPECVDLPEFDAAAWRLAGEAIPALELPEGVDAAEYTRSVMERYRNRALGHQTLQVAMDGSQKLPLRIVPTALAALRRGDEPVAAALTAAAWMVFVARGRTVGGAELPLDDPLAERLRSAAAGAESGLADRMLAVREVFPAELAEHPRWRELVGEAVARFGSDEPRAWATF
ncbi:MAG: mannitol dehydrogenase family protein [Protaetiibacter sp.]